MTDPGVITDRIRYLTEQGADLLDQVKGLVGQAERGVAALRDDHTREVEQLQRQVTGLRGAVERARLELTEWMDLSAGLAYGRRYSSLTSGQRQRIREQRPSRGVGQPPVEGTWVAGSWSARRDPQGRYVFDDGAGGALVVPPARRSTLATLALQVASDVTAAAQVTSAAADPDQVAGQGG